MRVKRGVTSHKRHKKVLKAAKGMQHARRSSIKLAKQGVIRALQYAYRDRRNKKRDFRQLWITRINAATREHGVSYSAFMNGLKKNNVTIDRKVLAELAVHEPKAFESLVKTATK
jgi:large subunit ribosomal protein L20